MTAVIRTQPAVDIEPTQTTQVDNVRQFNLEQQVFAIEEDTVYIRELTASLKGLQQ